MWEEKAWTKTLFSGQFKVEPPFNVFCNHLAERHRRHPLYRDSQSPAFLLNLCKALSINLDDIQSGILIKVLRSRICWLPVVSLLPDEFLLAEPSTVAI